jgi:cytoskeleton protein RodZ
MTEGFVDDRAPETAPATPSSPGAALAAARQARGMTVTEVALRLKFSPRKIEALEADRFDALPGPTLVRGMVRSYAKLVGLDAKPLLEAVQLQLGRTPSVMRPEAMDVPFPREPRRGSLVYVLLSAVVVIAVGSVVIEWLLRPDEPPAVVSKPAPRAPVAATPTPLVVPAPEVVPAPPLTVVTEQSSMPAMRAAIVTAKRIELVFTDESWVEIRDAEGRVLFSQLNQPGTRRKVEGAAPFSLVIGNAAGVQLRYNDADIDLAPFTRTDVARLTLK